MANERKTVIITGGTKGIGRAAGVHLASLGYNIAISYSTDDAAAHEAEKAVHDAGGDVLVFQADVRDRGSVEGFSPRLLNGLESLTRSSQTPAWRWLRNHSPT